MFVVSVGCSVIDIAIISLSVGGLRWLPNFEFTMRKPKAQMWVCKELHRSGGTMQVA